LARKRRKSLLGIEAPESTAWWVIERYIEEASAKLESEWAPKYVEKIRMYMGDENKQALAQAKLTAYYLAMKELNLPEKYRTVMKEVKDTMRKKLEALVKPIAEKVKAGAPPARAR
jgi:hypothetical protein